ncbi:MAG: hypothetical protein EBR82_43105 [Caulobacteraceae bacterium]|nr:hypothetical protein [Caulobacteraceae bacterium]
MKTNRDITQNFPSESHNKITVPTGTAVKFIDGLGGGYAVADDAALIAAGAWEYDVKHRYFYIPTEAVADLPANAKLIRAPLAKKSDNWQETAFQWLVDINGQKFDYYTGSGHVDKHGKPTKPKLDDVLYALVMDASACEQSFEDWCADCGCSGDSIKAWQIINHDEGIV